MKKHLFIIDPPEKLNKELDTTLFLAEELEKQGDNCWFCLQENLELSGDGLTAYAFTFKQRENVAVSTTEFSTIHMRKDPPYDLDYITTTWLLDKAGTVVLNSPESLRNLNEKISILDYPDYIAPLLISSNPKRMYEFLVDKCNGDGIVKPLNLYSGEGIFRIKDSSTALSELGNLPSQMMIQPFDRSIYSGEVRVFTIGGKALHWCVKKPSEGQFMANSNFGSTRHSYTPSDDEQKMVGLVAKDLSKKGAHIVGFDIIGGKISEINITSPRLLWADGESPPFKELAKWVHEVN